MVLVAPDVVRYTFNGTYLGRPTANVLDINMTGTGGALDRTLSIRDLATRMALSWEVNLLPLISSAYSLDSVSWVDLDSATGTTGSTTVVFPGVGNLPQSGELTGAPYSGNTALLVQKDVAAARGQRQGRWYVAGLTENYVSGNDLDATLTGPMQEAFDAFYEDTVSPVEADYECFPVVVHTTTDRGTVPATVTYTGQSPLVGWSVQGRVASQRRRNRP